MEQLYDERMSVERLAELMRDHQPCVVLTGAGVSTESGIPDFRSPTGIWRQYDPMEYATIDAFLADPAKVWDFYGKRLAAVAAVEPNDGHRALADLERRGWVHAIVTQNVDGLHARAGSQVVVEVHGSLRTCRCLDCGSEVPFEQALNGLPLPSCPACRRVLKPGVVMFGELLPEEAIGRAVRLASEARLMLVVGSSLEVYPVAGLPLETLVAGGKVAIVNRGATQFDECAEVCIDAGAGETLKTLSERLQ
jgi:NAD-dependent deacetylase